MEHLVSPPTAMKLTDYLMEDQFLELLPTPRSLRLLVKKSVRVTLSCRQLALMKKCSSKCHEHPRIAFYLVAVVLTSRVQVDVLPSGWMVSARVEMLLLSLKCEVRVLCLGFRGCCLSKGKGGIFFGRKT